MRKSAKIATILELCGTNLQYIFTFLFFSTEKDSLCWLVFKIESLNIYQFHNIYACSHGSPLTYQPA